MKKGIFFFLVFQIIILCSCSGRKVSEKREEKDEIAYSIFEKGRSFQAGNLVTMGNYAHSGYSYIPIQWIVLEEKDGALLLLSLYGIDVQAFYDEFYFREGEVPDVITWENCTVRAWLNNVFFEKAFFISEQECIKCSTIGTPANSMYGTSGGGDTQDFIFLLSEDETKKYLSSAEERKTKTVPSGDNGWWLRSPGELGDTISYVTKDGEIDMSGTVAWESSVAVRPAMWVDLESVQQYSEWLYDQGAENDGKQVDEKSYQQILHSLPEYKPMMESTGVSYKSLIEWELYDTYSTSILEGEAYREQLQILGDQWCKAEDSTCIREKRGNYCIFETSQNVNTIFMRYDQIWERPCDGNHYLPRNFLIKSIEGTNRISEIQLEGYVKDAIEKEKLAEILKEILGLLNSDTVLDLNELCGTYQGESFRLMINSDASLYSEELGDHYYVRFY